MHFEGEFSVPGTAADVIRRFADVPRMAGWMPGAVLEPQAEDGSWPGAMVVAFGPKKINFKGRVTTTFDFDALTGSLHGRGAADMRAARIGVKVGFTLRDDIVASVPTTVVKIVSDAELGGVLADFARTGGVALANVIMADFARRAAAEFAKDELPVAQPPAVGASPIHAEASAGRIPGQRLPTNLPSAPFPLAAHTLLWAVLKAQFVRFGKWLGLIR
jgi:carbon monoxide dehydrogenase subunit G